MAAPARRSGGTTVLAELAGPAVVVAVVAVLGFLALELLKGVVVVLSYALGAALLLVVALSAARVLRGHTGAERHSRLRGLVLTAGLGVALLVVAHFLSRDGWLLVAVPVAWVVAHRAADRVMRGHRRRHPRPVTG